MRTVSAPAKLGTAARPALALLVLASLLAGSCSHKQRSVTAPPITPAPAPGGTPPANDVCSGASPYTLTGHRWPTSSPSFVDAASLPSAWRAAVDAAAATWNAAGSTLRITRQATLVTADVGLDGKSVVLYGALPQGVLGTTYSWYNTTTHRLTEADIVLSASALMTVGGSRNSVDVQSVITHEFGHFVGLDHVSDPTHTMYPSISDNSTIARTLCDGDVAGVRNLYP
jgi:predicted Zn-dependent protease